MRAEMIAIGLAAVLAGCNSMPADQDGGSSATDTRPSPAQQAAEAAPETASDTSTTITVPGTTQTNSGAQATTTQDRWNSAPPNNAVPSAAPPNQQ